MHDGLTSSAPPDYSSRLLNNAMYPTGATGRPSVVVVGLYWPLEVERGPPVLSALEGLSVFDAPRLFGRLTVKTHGSPAVRDEQL